MNSPINRTKSLTALRDIARALSGTWALDSTLDLIAEKTTAVTQPVSAPPRFGITPPT